MRVEIVANPKPPEPPFSVSENRALKTFLASVDAEDSLFRVTTCWTRQRPGPDAELHLFSGGAVLAFRDETLSTDRGLYLRLVEKLSGLLEQAGSADSLELRLGFFTKAETESPRPACALLLELISRGASPEQAELRWGLGIAHLQQALLFTSRHLRQQLSAS